MQAEIKGSTMPVLEMVLDPAEAAVSDHGEQSWMTANMQMSQTTSTGGLAATARWWVGSNRCRGRRFHRWCTGEHAARLTVPIVRCGVGFSL